MSQAEIYLITLAIIAVVIVFRVRRMTREQRFGLLTMWIVPIIFAALTAWIFVFDNFTSPLDIGLAVLALGLGAGIGWYQGTHTTVRVDTAKRAMFVKVSPIGIAIFLGVLVLRIAIRTSFGNGFGTAPAQNPAVLHSGANTVNAVSVLLLVVVVGMLAGLRAYLVRAYTTATSASPS